VNTDSGAGIVTIIGKIKTFNCRILCVGLGGLFDKVCWSTAWLFSLASRQESCQGVVMVLQAAKLGWPGLPTLLPRQTRFHIIQAEYNHGSPSPRWIATSIPM